MILALDLGTTNWKAVLLEENGLLCQHAHIPTPLAQEDGCPCYDPLAMPQHLRELLGQLDAAALARADRVALTGMAEAGLILDRETLEPLSTIWPWFDRRALPLFDRVKDQPPFAGRETVTGLPNGFKYGIYKFLTLLEKGSYDRSRCLWMGLVAYAAALLTDERAEDVTIAARTFALNVHTRTWDMDFLHALDLTEDNFPRLVHPGEAVGTLPDSRFGLKAGTKVCIGGHDHVCAAHACGLLEEGGVFLSTGTAQVMLGTCTGAETASGLSYGPCPAGPRYTCLGSIQSAGGSVNFWKGKLFPGEDFPVLLREAQEAPSPTGMLYFPYLGGSGAPHLNPHARGGLLGLSESTVRGSIIAAVYEGLALESRYLLDHMTADIPSLTVMGGLTRHPRYMQTLADVTGLRVQVPALDEGTLYGAARLCAPLPPLAPACTYTPDPQRHAAWTQVYEQRYLPLMNLMQLEA